MNTITSFSITTGSVSLAVGTATAERAVVIVAIAVLVCYIAREFRLWLRERRDDATARYMFALCEQPGPAFEQYTEVLKLRDNPP